MNLDISLYAILDPEHCLGRPLGEMARIAAENGATLLQYRDKLNGGRAMVENAIEIREALEGTGVPFIMNDRLDVALISKADGVHLGQEDIDVADARAILGRDAIIGLSIKTVMDAETCPVDVVDYAFIGGVYDTTSKDNGDALGLDGWLERANIIKNKAPDLPLGAIAGINKSNAADIFKVGCEGVAVISALFKQSDVAGVARELKQVIEEVKS